MHITYTSALLRTEMPVFNQLGNIVISNCQRTLHLLFQVSVARVGPRYASAYTHCCVLYIVSLCKRRCSLVFTLVILHISHCANNA